MAKINRCSLGNRFNLVLRITIFEVGGITYLSEEVAAGVL